MAIIVTLAGFMPWGFLNPPVSAGISAVLWNVGLVALWGIIHTVMARQSFKDVLTQLLPEPAERPTYVWVAGATSIALVGFWQTLPGQLWQVETTWAVQLIWGVFVFGWVFCLAATFAINHFDLFGLRQVYLHYKNLPKAPLSFVKRAMYQYVRHPIQTGVIIGVWATPFMTMTQLVLSIGFTVYIWIGLWFEERDLVQAIGQDYIDYRDQTGKLFPRIGRR
jgi:protein-S-isoprenylcysteine O-methyltransferase Ste14